MTSTGQNEEFLPFAKPDIGPREVEAVAEAVRSGWLTTGKNAAAFEREFAEQIAPDRIAVAVNSATAGLHLALEALGVGPDDEVIVPDWTFTATAEVVRYLGASPILVDVDPRSLNIDVRSAERAITSKTKAIIPVHFAGLAADMSRLWDVAARAGIAVVEDAAHAIPTASNGVRIGAGRSEAVVYSFYATKTITTGEGGMVLVRDEALAARIRTMRLHGISRDVFDRYSRAGASWHYEVVAPGYKYNLPDPAAAMGRVQLDRAQEMWSRRADIADAYHRALSDLPIQLPAQPERGDVHAWHLYVVRMTENVAPSRDEFIDAMSTAGVGTSVHFIPLHMHPYWRAYCEVDDSDFPVSTKEFRRVVSLPIYSGMTDNDVERVIRCVRGVLA